MSLDLIVRGARLPDARAGVTGSTSELADIGVAGGRIVRVAPRLDLPALGYLDAGGRVVIPGLIESHFHLDKALLGSRATTSAGTVQEAIRATAEAKRSFTVEDIAARARQALELAIRHGTTTMRTHVEVDPIVGLKGMEALLSVRAEYAWAVDLQLCVFPQEGIFQTPGTERLMREALAMGGDVVGGVPYNDTDARAHIRLVFDLAREFDRDVDFHLDFADDADALLIPDVVAETVDRGWQGRVCAGHMTALGALEPREATALAARIRDAGISVLVLPATDLYLMGRRDVRNVRRGLAPVRLLLEAGVNVAVSTNNIRNPFTPFGDADLLRLVNLLANAAHMGTQADLAIALRMVTEHAARALRHDAGTLTEGAPADLVVLDCTDPRDAVAAIPERLAVVKRGAVSVTNRVETTFARPRPS